MQQHADRPDSGGPQAVDLARSLLELISQSSQGMRLTDAAQVLKVSKTRAYRLLSVLAERGYVRQEPISKRYFVGPMSLTLASVASGGFQLRDVAREYLERLNRDTGETVHLAVYSHGEVIYIDKLDTVHAVGPKSDSAFRSRSCNRSRRVRQL